MARFLDRFDRSGSTRAAALRTTGTGAPAGRRLALTLLGALCLCAALAASASAASPPALTIAAPTAITYHSAQLEGTVNPEGETGSEPTTWSFELSSDAGSTWTPLTGHEITGAAAEEARLSE